MTGQGLGPSTVQFMSLVGPMPIGKQILCRFYSLSPAKRYLRAGSLLRVGSSIVFHRGDPCIYLESNLHLSTQREDTKIIICDGGVLCYCESFI